MTVDRLRKLVNALDRERARTHRLTGGLVLADRNSVVAPRRVCGTCWLVIDAAVRLAHFRQWRASRKRCKFYDDRAAACQGHWQRRSGSWVTHRYPGMSVGCPSCGGPLSEVVW